jgi:hypothetical protein
MTPVTASGSEGGSPCTRDGQLEPVIDVMDAVALELQAMEWREKVA